MKKIFRILISLSCVLLGSVLGAVFITILRMLPDPFDVMLLATIATVSIIINLYQKDKNDNLTDWIKELTEDKESEN